MMDLPLRTISYIADIGNMVVLMARGKMVRSRSAQEHLNHTTDHSDHTNSPARDDLPQYRMVCHVFESEDVSVFTNDLFDSDTSVCMKELYDIQRNMCVSVFIQCI